MGANPYLIEGPALISFSMGRTSGMMLYSILDAHDGKLPPDVYVGTANTGDEAEASLRFGDECSQRWGVPISVVEFDPTAEHQTRLVTFETASRRGEQLDAAIATRPTAHLYNPVSRYCTATTKLRRLQKFMLHWCGHDRWTSVLGIRHDEPRRVASNRARSGRDRQEIALPLDDAKVTNADVLAFWAGQPFDLGLPVINGATELGNCEVCCLKSRSKLIRILRDDPSKADRMIAREERMRARIADVPFTGRGTDARASFFKDGASFRDLLAIAQQPAVPAFLEPQEESLDCACTD